MACDVEFHSGGNQYSAALADIWQSIKHPSVWLLLAAHENLGRRRLANLGAFWTPISTGLFVGGVGFIFSELVGKPVSFYYPYLASGILVWRLIAGITGESSSVFSARRGFIESVRLPLSTYPLIVVTKHLISFVLAFPIYLVVAIYFRIHLGYEMLLLIPALALYAITAFGVLLSLGILTLRFPDLGEAITAVLPFFFLFTPVVWIAEGSGLRAQVSKYNPFYHLLELSRSIMTGNQINPINWIVSGGICLCALTLGLLLFSQFRRRLPYWM